MNNKLDSIIFHTKKKQTYKIIAYMGMYQKYQFFILHRDDGKSCMLNGKSPANFKFLIYVPGTIIRENEFNLFSLSAHIYFSTEKRRLDIICYGKWKENLVIKQTKNCDSIIWEAR